MNKFKNADRSRLINFGIWAVIFILFSVWTSSWWLLLGILVPADVYLTKFIPWGAWKKSKNPRIASVLNGIDDLLFALVAVYIINIFVFQNYQIPSSSLEKSLLVGDFLFVSKLSYGPRIPNTPIAFPLVQNTLPFFNCKSYLDWPDWGYKRVKGNGSVHRDDIVVFNFPAGDTVALNRQNTDYYTLKHYYGEAAIRLNKAEYGEIIYRPVDKRENYVKRCVGMPGDSLQIIDNQVYIDGKILPNKSNVQFVYYVETDGTLIKDEIFRRMKVSLEDRKFETEKDLLSYLGFRTNSDGRFNPVYKLPLTVEACNILKKMPSVKNIKIEPDNVLGNDAYYPPDYPTGWTRDNYGPIWIPSKGATITLDERNLALYQRCIRNYENNTLEVRADGTVLINGQETASYTFKYDYYWMMGDNRHLSADSRSWGFVPEDHIVGKPIMVWLSIDKDHNLFNGGIRWSRMFRFADSFN
ncbi:MAG: S26 family signal peptidase [Tannerella sp.]|jgi:signal peptidase I|nr:S26 family signal peptidase [Tannerella sp.]